MNYMRKSENPCLGCVPPKRHLGCHGKCPERDEFIKKNEEIKEKKRIYEMCRRRRW